MRLSGGAEPVILRQSNSPAHKSEQQRRVRQQATHQKLNPDEYQASEHEGRGGTEARTLCCRYRRRNESSRQKQRRANTNLDCGLQYNVVRIRLVARLLSE